MEEGENNEPLEARSQTCPQSKGGKGSLRLFEEIWALRSNGYLIGWPQSCPYICFKMLMLMMLENTFLLGERRKIYHLPIKICFIVRYLVTIFKCLKWPQMDWLGHVGASITLLCFSPKHISFLFILNFTIPRAVSVPMNIVLKRAYPKSQSPPWRCTCLSFSAHRPYHFLIKGHPRLRVTFKNCLFCAKRVPPLSSVDYSCLEAFS